MAVLRVLMLVAFMLDCILRNTASAQSVPPSAKAGVLASNQFKKQTLKEYDRILHIIEWEYPQGRPQMPATSKVYVETFVFSGNSVVSTRSLQKLTAADTHQEITFADLSAVAGKITEYYHKQGYFLAKAYVPPQDIRNKKVSIEIIEGRLGEVGIMGARDKKLVLKILERYFHPAKNNVLHYQSLLRSILVINENTSLNIKTYLQKGHHNLVDIIVQVEEKKQWEVQSIFDNYGSRFVSRQRESVELTKTNAILSGDKLTITDGTGFPWGALEFAQVDYSELLNSYGTRLGFSYFWLDSNVQGQFRVLNAVGTSAIYSFSLNQPLIKTIDTNVQASLNFDIKDIRNGLLGAVSSKDDLRNVRIELSGDHLDSFYGRNSYLSQVTLGIPDILSGSAVDNPLASRLGASSRFEKYFLQADRTQALPMDVTAFLRGAYQFTPDILTSVEEFSIGGVDTVRGYPESEALGDEGAFVSLEFRRPVYKDILTLTAFLDYGSVRLKEPQPGERKTQELLGTGPGALIAIHKNISAKLDLGFPIGHKPSDVAKATLYFQVIIKF